MGKILDGMPTGSDRNQIQYLAAEMEKIGGFSPIHIETKPIMAEMPTGNRTDMFFLVERNIEENTIDIDSLMRGLDLESAISYEALVTVDVNLVISLANFASFSDIDKLNGLGFELYGSYTGDRVEGSPIHERLVNLNVFIRDDKIIAKGTRTLLLTPLVFLADSSQFLGGALDWTCTGYQFSEYSDGVMWAENGLLVGDGVTLDYMQSEVGITIHDIRLAPEPELELPS